MDFLNWLMYFVFYLILFQAFHLITRRKLGRFHKLPPGPPTIPIFGNLFQVGDKPHRSLAKLAKIHGDIMTLKLGHNTTVVFSSATMAKEILQKHDAVSCNRTIPDALRALQHHEAGLPWMPVSTTWRNLRKICNLHIFATQKLDANQYLRRSKVEQLLAGVRESSLIGEAIEIRQAAFKTTLSLISNTIFSIDLVDSTHTSEEFREIVQGIMEELGKPNFGDYFPIANLDLQGIRRRVAILLRKMMDLFDKMVDERMELRKMNDYISTDDFLDILLQLIHQGNNGKLDRNLIKHLILVAQSRQLQVLWNGQWRNYSKTQKFCRKRGELKQIIGEGNLLEESNITCLPYLQAIVKETMRLHPSLPLLLPRKAEADIEIHSFVIPKGTQLLINAWAIGRDPKFWEEPDLFRPERFIRSEMDVKGRDFGLIPFGGGRRICPGLPLAIRMLHLMLGGLIHSFGWKLENNITPESLDMKD
ncbi:hypothetical protein Gogos_010680, partial [Gossypium gossypioides]|nr:hypothetical protein [Gossypium gossypioides]